MDATAHFSASGWLPPAPGSHRVQPFHQIAHHSLAGLAGLYPCNCL